MSNLNDDDLFAYQEAATGNTGAVANDNRSNLEDDDLFVVYRPSTGLNYKVKAEDVGGGVDPIEVSKGVISPTSGVEAEDTLTGTATVTGNVDPTVYIHKWFVDGVIYTSGTANTFIAKEGNVTYQLCVTDPNNTTPVCGAISDAVTVGPRTTPNATMHGLRFDSARATYLDRTLTIPSSGWTISFWIKPSSTSGSNYVINLRPADLDPTEIVMVIAGSVIECNYIDATRINIPIVKNIWQHIVYSFDGSQVKAYADGDLIGTSSASQTDLSGIYNIGRAFSEDNNLNGYLSDFYFVERALPPTTFGKDFDLGWGPLDSSVVEDNIGIKISPYDTRPNMYDSYGGVGTDAVFDTDLTNYVSSNANLTLLTNGTFVINETLEILVNDGSGFTQLQFNDAVTVTGPANNGQPNWLPVDISALTLPFTANSTKYRYTEGNSRFYAIRVDGRQLLLGGPATNDTIESVNLFASSGIIVNPEYAFNASLNTTCYLAAGNGEVLFWYNRNNLGGSKWEVYVYRGNGTGISNLVKFNSGGQWINAYTNSYDNSSGSALYGWVELYDGVRTVPGEIAVQIQTEAAYIGAIRVDGKIIVDAPDLPWDTSQVWSDGLSGTGGVANGPYAFNGDTSNNAGAAQSGAGNFLQIDFTDVTVISSLKLYCVSHNNLAVEVNGVLTDFTNISGGDSGVIQMDGFTGELNTVKIYQKGGNVNIVGNCSAVYIDDEILVDGGTFGTNGFYLPFDPATAGAIWSATGTATNWSTGDYALANAFKGTAYVSGSADPGLPEKPASTNGANALWDLGVNRINNVSSLKVWFFNSRPDNITQSGNLMKINGTDVSSTAFSQAGTTKWFLVDFGATFSEFQSIEIGYESGNYLYLGGIEVNNELLIDNSPIGVDASGNGNNFSDENFAVGPTGQLWSLYLQSDSGTFHSGEGRERAFNGDPNQQTGAGSSSNSFLEWTPLTGEFTGSHALKVRASTSGAAATVIAVDGSGTEVTLVEGDLGYWITNLTGIKSVKVSVPNARADLYFIEIDGQMLIDGTPDTVLDTPMRNYAVLMDRAGGASANNGNLVGQGGNSNAYSSLKATQTLSAGAKYYWETTPFNGDGNGKTLPNIGVEGDSNSYYVPYANLGIEYGDVIGVTYDPDTNNIQFFVNGVKASVNPEGTPPVTAKPYIEFYGAGVPRTAVNFGQQPFVYATDNGDGTVTIANTSPNMDQKWSIDGVSGNVFDGNLNTTLLETTFPRVISNKSITVNSSIEIYCNDGMGSQSGVIINGGNYKVSEVGNDLWKWRTVDLTGVPLPATLDDIRITYDGQGNSYAALKIDGRILIDGPANNSQVWSTLGTIVNPSGSGIVPGHPAYPIANLYDGDFNLGWGADGNVTKSQTDLSIPFITLVKMKVMTADGNGSLTVFGSNGSSATINGSSLSAGVAEEVSFSGIESPITGFEYTGVNGFYLYKFEVDGEPLVDGIDSGTFNTLSQTWSQWVVSVTRELLARSTSRVDALEQVVLAQAVDWSYGETYKTDDLVKFNCSVWRAKSDGITTRTPILTNADIWENLEINCERTHTMDDLIPDDWSAEQRRAALQELLQELSQDEPEGY